MLSRSLLLSGSLTLSHRIRVRSSRQTTQRQRRMSQEAELPPRRSVLSVNGNAVLPGSGSCTALAFERFGKRAPEF